MNYHFQKSRITIGVWINQFEGSYQSLLFKGLLDSAADSGINIQFFDGRAINSPHIDHSEHNAIYQLAIPERFDGWLFSGALFSNFNTLDKTCALLERFQTVPVITITLEVPGITSIRCDNSSGMKALMRHFIEDHHAKRLAFIRGPKSSQDAEERYKVFCDSLSDYQITFDPSLVFEGDFTFRGGRKFAETISVLKKMPLDAAVFANDEMALSALSVFQKNGINVPVEFGISGFDNVPNSYINNPSLTTINQPIYEQGYQAVKMLIEKINGKNIPLRNYLESKLIVRETCGCQLLDINKLDQTGKYYIKPSKNGEPVEDTQSERKIFENKAVIIDSIVKKIKSGQQIEKEMAHSIQVILDMISFDLKNMKSKPMTIIVLKELLEMVNPWNNYNELWYEILMNMIKEIKPFCSESRQISYLDELSTRMIVTLSSWDQRRQEKIVHNLKNFILDLPNTFGRIHSHLTKDQMIGIFNEELKKIGIQKAFLALYQDGPIHKEDIKSGLKAQLKIAYDDTTDYLDALDGLLYPVDLLLPDQLVQESNTYNLLWMELFSFDEHFGFIGLEILRQPWISYYLIRERISSSFYTAGLVERQLKSKQEIQDYNNQLMQERERYRDMAMMLPAVVIETGPDLMINFINHSGMEALGIAQQDSTRLSLKKYLPEEDNEKLKKYLEVRSQDTDIQDLNISLINPLDKKIIPVSRLDPVYGQAGGIIILRWFAIDLLPLVSDDFLPDNEFARKFHITKREKEIMDLIIQGFRVKDIAGKLFIAESTVKGHVSELYSKLGISKKTELIELINKTQIQKSGHQNYVYQLLSQLLNPK